MINDPIADLLTRIRNGRTANHKAVRVKSSKMAERILTVLRAEGFIENFNLKKDKENKFDEFEVILKYSSSGEAVLQQLKRVSTPGRRVYASSDSIPTVHAGLGICLVSTSQGVLSDREARKRKIGGEILAFIS